MQSTAILCGAILTPSNGMNGSRRKITPSNSMSDHAATRATGVGTYSPGGRRPAIPLRTLSVSGSIVFQLPSK